MKIEFSQFGFRPTYIANMNDTPLIAVDILLFVKQVREEAYYKSSLHSAQTFLKLSINYFSKKRNNKTVNSDKNINESLVCLRVLEGQMQFNTDEQSIRLGRGQVLLMNEHIKQNVFANEQTIFLLTVSNGS